MEGFMEVVIILLDAVDFGGNFITCYDLEYIF